MAPHTAARPGRSDPRISDELAARAQIKIDEAHQAEAVVANPSNTAEAISNQWLRALFSTELTRRCKSEAVTCGSCTSEGLSLARCPNRRAAT